MIDYALSLIGIPYGYWDGGADTSDATPFYAENAEQPSRTVLESQGASCTGFLNLCARAAHMPVPGVPTHEVPGGTGAWGEYLAPYAQPFDPKAAYEDGTLLFRPYKDWMDQGHIALIYKGQTLHSYPERWDPHNRQKSGPGVCLTEIWPDYYTIAVPLKDWLRPSIRTST